MWIKLTIILGIIAICSYVLAKVIFEALEPNERFAAAIGYPPNKVFIPSLIAVISGIAAVVCLIITIVTW